MNDANNNNQNSKSATANVHCKERQAERYEIN
jgi:hypothetical protein